MIKRKRKRSYSTDRPAAGEKDTIPPAPQAPSRQPRLLDAPPGKTPYLAFLLRHLPLRERPASRVAEYGAPACSLVELLAAVVGGSQQIEIAHGLIERFGDVTGISGASTEELAQVQGLGAARAAALLSPWIGHLQQEHFVVMLLDTRNHVIGQETLYKGSLNASHIRVGEVIREAIRRNCGRMQSIRAIIVAHNHPSGVAEPSPEDAALTRRLIEAGDTLDVELVDHLIVSRTKFVSLRERTPGDWK